MPSERVLGPRLVSWECRTSVKPALCGARRDDPAGQQTPEVQRLVLPPANDVPPVTSVPLFSRTLSPYAPATEIKFKPVVLLSAVLCETITPAPAIRIPEFALLLLVLPLTTDSPPTPIAIPEPPTVPVTVLFKTRELLPATIAAGGPPGLLAFTV